MGITFYFDWEVKLMVFLQKILPEFGIKIASFISIVGVDIMMVAVLGYFYFIYDKKYAIKIGLNMMIAGIFFSSIKNVFKRRRPYMDNPDINCLVPVDRDYDVMDVLAQGYSFPSGHSINAVTIYGSIAYYVRKRFTFILGIILPLLIGISRVILGNHYPTDVIVGWAIGIVIIFVVPYIIDNVKDKKIGYLILFLISSLGVFLCDSNDYYTTMGMLFGMILGDLFENKYVNFEMTKSVKWGILRLIGCGIIYFGLNYLLKLPFSEAFLMSQNFGQHLVRFLRYSIILFIELGIYPMIFKKIEK